MIILRGKGASSGVEMGKIRFYQNNDCRIEKKYTENWEQEIRRFEDASAQVYQELEELHTWATSQMGVADAEIFAAHQMILKDPEFVETVMSGMQQQHLGAEYAVQLAVEHFTNIFANVEDEQIQARVADVQDIGIRLVGILSEDQEICREEYVIGQDDCRGGFANHFSGLAGEDKVIVAAVDLLPSETVRLDKNKVLGFVTQYGSLHSHAAILARNQKFPAIVDLGESLCETYDDMLAIIDGTEGVLYIDPDAETIEIMKEKRHLEEEQETELVSLLGKENQTLSGQKIDIFANIGKAEDVRTVKEADANGIGLFRSECLYLERQLLPTEEEQYEVYKAVAQQMQGKPVIIRTMDIGADKQVDYLPFDKEENPALGCRGIRFCLKHQDIFKTQLRAICRASAYGQIGVMFPMITSVDEVKRIKDILQEVRKELRCEGASYDESMEIGIMIETPAAVMISRELAKEVDFLSIGTNDLTQYALAVDRQNSGLHVFYDERHPAVLAMIQMVVDHAHAEGKRVGICGELAADLEMTETFIKMGVDELSVAPTMILPLRKKIREIK